MKIHKYKKDGFTNCGKRQGIGVRTERLYTEEKPNCKPCNKSQARSKKMKNQKEVKEFIRDLILIKDRAARLGLFETMHAIDGATKKVGYEVSEILKKKAS